jgi:hypothetical protein
MQRLFYLDGEEGPQAHNRVESQELKGACPLVCLEASASKLIILMVDTAVNLSKGFWRPVASGWTLGGSWPKAAYPLAQRPSSTSARFRANPSILQD